MSFALGEEWTEVDGIPDPETYNVLWAREFRYDGARARYLNRELDPDTLDPITETEVWSDYDDDAIYGDFRVEGGSFVELMSYEAGVARVVDPLGTAVTSHFHGDMIGSMRMMTDGASGSTVAQGTYTAFGGTCVGRCASVWLCRHLGLPDRHAR